MQFNSLLSAKAQVESQQAVVLVAANGLSAVGVLALPDGAAFTEAGDGNDGDDEGMPWESSVSLYRMPSSALC